ncbi:hypothetical protein Tco_1560672, partial [Tanacetum coccineum]
ASQRKGKAVLEETPQTKRTKKQIREEQASLAEIERIQAEDEAKNARREELKRQDKLAVKRLQEELELSEAQNKRMAQVQEAAQFYKEEDWDKIRAKLEANADLVKQIAGEDVSEADYAQRMGGWKLALDEKLTDEELNNLSLNDSLVFTRVAESLFELKPKKILFEKMDKSRSYMTHDKHQELYDALLNSIMIDEAIASGNVNPAKVIKKETVEMIKTLLLDQTKGRRSEGKKRILVHLKMIKLVHPRKVNL